MPFRIGDWGLGIGDFSLLFLVSIRVHPCPSVSILLFFCQDTGASGMKDWPGFKRNATCASSSDAFSTSCRLTTSIGECM